MEKPKSTRSLIALTRVVIATLVVSTVACFCSSERPKISADATAVAQTAIALATRVAELEATSAFQTLVARPEVTETPTPTCNGPWVYFQGELICSPSLLTTPDLTPSEGEFIVPWAGAWGVWYHLESGERLELKSGTSWPEQDSLLTISGWIPDFDLVLSQDQKTGITRCDYHTWGHPSLCHTHIFDDAGEVIAVIPSDVKFQVNLEYWLTGVTMYRTVKDKDGNEVLTSGRVVTLVEKAVY